MNSKTASLRGALGIAVVTGVAACLASFASPAVHAIERYIVPEQGAGGPFYARLERGFVHMTD